MGNRRTVRSKVVLPLRLSGTNSEGKPFSILAHTLDLSPRGARVAGVREKLAVGAILNVQYRMNRSQFRVMWVGGVANRDQIGLAQLDASKKMLGVDLPDEPMLDDFEPPEDNEAKYKKHRAHARHLVDGGAEVRTVTSHTGLWAKLVDISLKGCYLQMTNPVAVETRARLLLKIGPTEIDMRGVVRSCHPQVGMGVEFTEPTTPADGTRLQNLIHWLITGERAAEEPPPKIASLNLLPRLDAVTTELQLLEEQMQSAAADPLLLRQVHETLTHLRTSSTAVQTWLNMQASSEDAALLHNFLIEERVHAATRLCRSLAKEMPKGPRMGPGREMEHLLRAVEDLFANLAGFTMEIGKAGAAADLELREEEELASTLPDAQLSSEDDGELIEVAALQGSRDSRSGSESAAARVHEPSPANTAKNLSVTQTESTQSAPSNLPGKPQTDGAQDANDSRQSKRKFRHKKSRR